MKNCVIRLRTGLFVLAAIGLLGLLVVWFAGAGDYFQETTKYTVVFDFAPNVAPGVRVRKWGVPIGKVSAVTLNEETGQVDVVVAIDAKHSLSKGDEPYLKTAYLGSDAVIDFMTPRKTLPNRALYEAGARIPGIAAPMSEPILNATPKVAPTDPDTVAVLQKLVEKIDQLTIARGETATQFCNVAVSEKDIATELAKFKTHMEKVAKKVDAGPPNALQTNDEIQLAARNLGKAAERIDVLVRTNETRVEGMMAKLDRSLKGLTELVSEDNQKNLAVALANFRKGSDRFNSITSSAVGVLQNGQMSMAKVNHTLAQADKAFKNLEKATQPLANDGQGILKNLEESTHKLNLAMDDVREVMKVVNSKQGSLQLLLTDPSLYRRLDSAANDVGKILQLVTTRDGTLQRLLADPSLYRNLDDAACGIVKALPRVERILRDLEIFADKLARHPELIGIRGFFRPGSGLKQSPTILPYYGP